MKHPEVHVNQRLKMTHTKSRGPLPERDLLCIFAPDMVCTAPLLAGFGGVDFGATTGAGLLVGVADFVDIVSDAVGEIVWLVLMSKISKK